MSSVRESWTDARLDDFRGDVDRRFDDLNQKVDTGFARVDTELRALNARFDTLNRTLLQLGGGVIVALIGLIATQL